MKFPRGVTLPAAKLNQSVSQRELDHKSVTALTIGIKKARWRGTCAMLENWNVVGISYCLVDLLYPDFVSLEVDDVDDENDVLTLLGFGLHNQIHFRYRK